MQFHPSDVLMRQNLGSITINVFFLHKMKTNLSDLTLRLNITSVGMTGQHVPAVSKARVTANL